MLLLQVMKQIAQILQRLIFLLISREGKFKNKQANTIAAKEIVFSSSNVDNHSYSSSPWFHGCTSPVILLTLHLSKLLHSYPNKYHYLSLAIMFVSFVVENPLTTPSQTSSPV